MQKIEEVEKAISFNEELLEATKKRLKDTTAKLSESRGNVKRIESEIKDTKEKRQVALARGGDSKSLNDSLKKAESELELETETVAGLEKFMAELQQEEASLQLKLGELPKRILQLKSIGLAALYNEKASELAPVIEELNQIYYKLTGNGNRKENAVCFYPMEGCFDKLPKIFYDEAGLNLEAFVGKHPGKFHSNNHLAAEEKNYYDWALHQNQLRNKG